MAIDKVAMRVATGARPSTRNAWRKSVNAGIGSSLWTNEARRLNAADAYAALGEYREA